MAGALDQAFIMSVNAAEGVRQGARAAALATYTAAGFTPAARATYITAYVAADLAYGTAVANARTTGSTNLTGTVCDFAPYGGFIGSVST
jgi:hypothetical protein